MTKWETYSDTISERILIQENVDAKFGILLYRHLSSQSELIIPIIVISSIVGGKGAISNIN